MQGSQNLVFSALNLMVRTVIKTKLTSPFRHYHNWAGSDIRGWEGWRVRELEGGVVQNWLF